MGPAWKAQKTWYPNHPTPMRAILAGVIGASVFKVSSSVGGLSEDPCVSSRCYREPGRPAGGENPSIADDEAENATPGCNLSQLRQDMVTSLRQPDDEDTS